LAENDPATIDNDKIAQDREAIQTRINDLVTMCLQKFSNPNYLLLFAQDMAKRDEFDLVIRIVHKCLDQIQSIEILRIERQPMQQQLDELDRQKAELAQQGASLSDDKLATYQLIANALPLLPPFPHYASLNEPKQFDSVKRDVILCLIKSTLAERYSLDAMIAQMVSSPLSSSLIISYLISSLI